MTSRRVFIAAVLCAFAGALAFFVRPEFAQAQWLRPVIGSRDFLECVWRSDLIVVGTITELRSREFEISVSVLRSIKGDATGSFTAKVGGFNPNVLRGEFVENEQVLLMVVRARSGGDPSKPQLNLCGSYDDGKWPKTSGDVNQWPYTIPGPTLAQVEFLAARASRLDPKDEGAIREFLTEMWRSDEPFRQLFAYRYLRHPERESLRSSFQEEMATYEPPFLRPGSVKSIRPNAAPTGASTVAGPASAGPSPFEITPAARGAISVPRPVTAVAPSRSTEAPVTDTIARPAARESGRFGAMTIVVVVGVGIAVGSAILVLRRRRKSRGG